MNRMQITKEQAFYAMENDEFSNEVISSNKCVAIILTQDWCPHWQRTSQMIESLEKHNELDVYELVYNQVEYFDEFRYFKESTWKNGRIPYIRYYISGKLVNETNPVTEKEFLDNLGLK